MAVKIKIVFVVDDLDLYGTARVVLEMCKALDTAKFKLRVISLSKRIALAKSTDWPDRVEVESFDYIYDPDYSVLGYLKLTFYRLRPRAFKVRDIMASIENYSPDIVHFHTTPRELTLGRLLSLRPILVYSDHSYRPLPANLSYLKKWLLKLSMKRLYEGYHTISVSNAVFSLGTNLGLHASDKINRVITNKIDVHKFTPSAKRPRSHDDRLNVVYVARLARLKGHEFLLKAWAAANFPNATLTLVGSGEMMEKLTNLARYLGITDSVEFIGETQDIVAYLHRADLAVFPTSQEGMPLALLEKMASGLAVLASDIQPNKEIITDGVNGLLFNLGSQEDFVKKLKNLISLQEMRNQLGLAARLYVTKYHNVELLEAEMVGFYNDTLEHSKKKKWLLAR